MSGTWAECFLYLNKPHSDCGTVIYGRNSCQSSAEGVVQEIIFSPAIDNTDKIKVFLN